MVLELSPPLVLSWLQLCSLLATVKNGCDIKSLISLFKCPQRIYHVSSIVLRHGHAKMNYKHIFPRRPQSGARKGYVNNYHKRRQRCMYSLLEEPPVLSGGVKNSYEEEVRLAPRLEEQVEAGQADQERVGLPRQWRRHT